MKQILSALTCLSLAVVSASAFADEKAKKPATAKTDVKAAATAERQINCDVPKTTYEMLECNTRRLNKAQAELNAHLAILRKSGGFNVSKLDAAQQSWSLFVDQDCAWQSSNVEGGTLENVNYGSCRAEWTEARAAQFKKMIAQLGVAPKK